jgi:hypothetical protein
LATGIAVLHLASLSSKSLLMFLQATTINWGRLRHTQIIKDGVVVVRTSSIISTRPGLIGVFARLIGHPEAIHMGQESAFRRVAFCWSRRAARKIGAYRNRNPTGLRPAFYNLEVILS